MHLQNNAKRRFHCSFPTDKLRHTLLVCFLINCCIHPVFAQWSPERNVEIIVGASAGGAQDRGARVIQRIIQDRKLIPVNSNVINKVGGGGATAWSYQNMHPSDAHYLSITSPPLLTNRITGTSAIDFADFTALSLMFDEHIVFVVRPDSPIKSGKELVTALRENSTAYSAAIATSLGGSNHIGLGLPMKEAGVDLKKLKVVVFNSAGESVTTVLGGHVDFGVVSAANAAGLIKSHKLRGLATLSERRIANELAEVPTWREQGINAAWTTWRGIAGPKGLNQQQIAYWDRVMAAVSETPEWKSELEKNFWGAHYLNSSDAKKYIESQYKVLSSLLQDLGLAK
jgi:putative tricarboxylic transport membrane protein